MVLRMVVCALVAPAWALDGAAPAAAVPPAMDSPAALFDFDIPAQPLGTALNRYADTTGRPALVPSEIIGNRMSATVRGRHTAAAALQILLEGAGLVADRRSSPLGETFVLKAPEPLSSDAPRSGLAALFGTEGYAGLLQARVWQALCADRLGRPGRYSAVLRFELDAQGRVGGTRLIGGSGDAERDAALLGTLRRVRIERAPPVALVQQPLTIRIAPELPGAGPRCAPLQGAG